jgi:hypothetical protein
MEAAPVGAKCRRSPRNLLAELAAITSQIWAQQTGAQIDGRERRSRGVILCDR